MADPADDSFEGIDAPAGPGTGDDVADAMAAIKALDTGEALASTTESEGRTDDTPTTASPAGKDAVSDVVDKDPQGVLTADGKNFLPYDVLKSARERVDTEAQGRQAAEDAARSAQEQLAAAQTELEQLRAGKDTAGADTSADRAGSSERITQLEAQADAIREELPAMAGVLDGMIEELKEVAALRAKLEEREAADTTKRQQVEQDASQQAAQAVRAAIDSNPTLAYWENSQDRKAVVAYNAACDFDDELKNDPAWAGKPITDRFNEAVKRTLDLMPNAPKPAARASAAEVEARARRAVKETPDFEPESLTDLPAGAHPGADPLESLANADVAALGNRARNMTDAQLNELMARLA